VVLLPELGKLDRKQIASLVGVTPMQMIVASIVDIGVPVMVEVWRNHCCLRLPWPLEILTQS